jgi:pyridoxal phosphate enzyme (YggS family)
VLDPAALRARLTGVRDRIARAASRAGRDPASIQLVAVSKTFPADAVRILADAGETDFGENKVQEATAKIEATTDLALRWHLVGHLQSNKARKAVACFDVIHSIDSEALLRTVDAAAAIGGRRLECFVQVDLAGEVTKHGARPEDLDAILAAAQSCQHAQVRGLMLLPPAADNPEASRSYFRALRGVRDELLARGAEPSSLRELSMGMSHDFDVAVEEGATLVRVGTAIFGAR